MVQQLSIKPSTTLASRSCHCAAALTRSSSMPGYQCEMPVQSAQRAAQGMQRSPCCACLLKHWEWTSILPAPCIYPDVHCTCTCTSMDTFAGRILCRWPRLEAKVHIWQRPVQTWCRVDSVPLAHGHTGPLSLQQLQLTLILFRTLLQCGWNDSNSAVSHLSVQVGHCVCDRQQVWLCCIFGVFTPCILINTKARCLLAVTSCFAVQLCTSVPALKQCTSQCSCGPA